MHIAQGELGVGAVLVQLLAHSHRYLTYRIPLVDD